MNYYQNIIKKCFEQNIPFFPYIELTRRCNLNCAHCYVLKDEIKKGDELTLSEIKVLLSDLRKMGSLFLTFTGGEIFLREDIFDIFEIASKEKFAIHLMTNGTLLTEAMIKIIKRFNVISIDITLFSMESSIHDKIVGVAGAQKKTLGAIEACVKNGISLTIKMPIMKQNVNDFKAVQNYAKSCKAQFVFDLILVPTDAGKDIMQELGLNETEMKEFIIANSYLKTNKKTQQEEQELSSQNEPLCGAGFSTICIAPDGTILPCPGLRIGIGNIRKESLLALWRSNKLDFIRNACYSSCTDCVNCSIKNYCARCPGAAFSERGSIYAPFTASCRLAKVMADIEKRRL